MASRKSSMPLKTRVSAYARSARHFGQACISPSSPLNHWSVHNWQPIIDLQHRRNITGGTIVDWQIQQRNVSCKTLLSPIGIGSCLFTLNSCLISFLSPCISMSNWSKSEGCLDLFLLGNGINISSLLSESSVMVLTFLRGRLCLRSDSLTATIFLLPTFQNWIPTWI